MSFRLLPLLLLLLAAPPAWATSMLKLDIPALTQHSDVVVRGTVVRQGSFWAEGRRRILTETEVEVLEVLKGSPGVTTLKVLQPGGVVGGMGQHVSGTARFQEKEQVLLFLEQRSPGVFQLTGMAQGKFRVERAADGQLVAVPELMGEALLLDPVTRQPVPSESGALPLLRLQEQVRTQAGTTAPRKTP